MATITLDAQGKVPATMIERLKAPSAIASEANGFVRDSLLSVVEEDHTAKIHKLAHLPARGMRALHAAIKAELGVALFTQGRGRTIKEQWDGFFAVQHRYQTCSVQQYQADQALNDERTKFWPRSERLAVAQLLNVDIPDSDYWTKVRQPNGKFLATAAVPGTSPHGFWCADDVCMANGDSIPLSVIEWLFANERQFGFAHGTPSEAWHVQWIANDTVPQAVLDFEAGRGHITGGGEGGGGGGGEGPDEQEEREDMAKAFKTPDGDAIFVASGIVMSWVNDPKDYNVAVFLGLAPSLDHVHIVDRSVFKAFRLVGAIPPQFSARDFQEVIVGESVRRDTAPD